uniref:Uncharacterized protein n=1 Tax=Octopus bimaculoides TaxID=37653 RepID=A0A0L8G6U8_OCTBM
MEKKFCKTKMCVHVCAHTHVFVCVCVCWNIKKKQSYRVTKTNEHLTIAKIVK